MKLSIEYNLVRHCGTLIALAEQGKINNNELLKRGIEKGISYIQNYLVENGNSLYVLESGEKQIKLDANALALLALV